MPAAASCEVLGRAAGAARPSPAEGRRGPGAASWPFPFVRALVASGKARRMFLVPSLVGLVLFCFVFLLLTDVSGLSWKASNLCFTGKRLTQQSGDPGCTIEVVPCLF